jgi:hypothetical protein
MEHDLKFRIALRDSLAKLEAAQPHASSIASAGRLASIVRDLEALLLSIEPDPKATARR